MGLSFLVYRVRHGASKSESRKSEQITKNQQLAPAEVPPYSELWRKRLTVRLHREPAASNLPSAASSSGRILMVLAGVTTASIVDERSNVTLSKIYLKNRDSPLAHETQPAYNLAAGWSSPVAREAHNLEVAGSNPVSAT